MLAKLLIAFCLMALCVAIHAVGLTAAIRWMRTSTAPAQSVWRWTGLLIAVAGITIVFHLVEITVWAVFYTWADGMPDMQSALYFSAVAVERKRSA